MTSTSAVTEPSVNGELISVVARVLQESPHAAPGVRRVVGELLHDLRDTLLAGASPDVPRATQTSVTLLTLLRAWPASAPERLLVRALLAQLALRKPSRRARTIG